MKRQSNLITLDNIRSVIKEELAFQEARFDLKLEELERKVDDKAQLYRDRVLNGIDRVVKELEDMRTDNILRDNRLDKYEKKLKKLDN